MAFTVKLHLHFHITNEPHSEACLRGEEKRSGTHWFAHVHNCYGKVTWTSVWRHGVPSVLRGRVSIERSSKMVAHLSLLQASKLQGQHRSFLPSRESKLCNETGSYVYITRTDYESILIPRNVRNITCMDASLSLPPSNGPGNEDNHKCEAEPINKSTVWQQHRYIVSVQHIHRCQYCETPPTYVCIYYTHAGI